MTDTNFRQLLGDPQRLSVERAIGELRAGRPVWLKHEDGGLLVVAFESLDAALFSALKLTGSNPRLLLTSARLRHMKTEMATPGALSIGDIPLTDVEDLVLGKEVLASREIEPATRAEQAALELVRLSLLLPAAVVMDIDRVAGQDRANLANVSASAIETFESGAANLLRLVSRAPVPLEGVEDCEFVVFRGGEGMRDQIAVIIGKPAPGDAVLVRIHSACLTGDLFGSLKCDCGDQLRGAVQRMADAGGGILLYLDQEGRGNGIANKIRAYALQYQGHDTYDADEILGFENDHRRFDLAAEMLHQLGFTAIRLMTNNPLKIEALKDAGLEVRATQRVIARANGHNSAYIAAKRDRAGHLFEKESSVVMLRAGEK